MEKRTTEAGGKAFCGNHFYYLVLFVWDLSQGFRNYKTVIRYTQYIGSFEEIKYAIVKETFYDEVSSLISYKPFYETLLKKGITEYALIFQHGMSANTLYRMKKGEAITTKTLDTLCFILDCSVSDILEYKRPD